jgi:hypothetical protein
MLPVPEGRAERTVVLPVDVNVLPFDVYVRVVKTGMAVSDKDAADADADAADCALCREDRDEADAADAAAAEVDDIAAKTESAYVVSVQNR